jgi:hypothetical protein
MQFSRQCDSSNALNSMVCLDRCGEVIYRLTETKRGGRRLQKQIYSANQAIAFGVLINQIPICLPITLEIVFGTWMTTLTVTQIRHRSVVSNCDDVCNLYYCPAESCINSSDLVVKVNVKEPNGAI